LEEFDQHTLLDPLTGARNRRSAEQVITQKLADLQRNTGRFGICLLDIDDFKQVNDRFGNEAGDLVLKTVARSIMGTVRAHDLVVRWGGEEFLIILAQKRDSDLKTVAERIRKIVETSTVEIGSKPIHVTVSLGVTTAQPTDTIESLFTRVDSLMLLSKNRGRNHTTYDEVVSAYK
jgi:diguanylate cyclase (GGDEF)-like protein